MVQSINTYLYIHLFGKIEKEAGNMSVNGILSIKDLIFSNITKSEVN